MQHTMVRSSVLTFSVNFTSFDVTTALILPELLARPTALKSIRGSNMQRHFCRVQGDLGAVPRSGTSTDVLVRTSFHTYFVHTDSD